jgi:hypothetical protein
MSRRSLKTVLRWLLLVGAGCAVVVPLGCVAWLSRDPLPGILARRDSIRSASVEEMSRDSGHVNERVVLSGVNGLNVRMILRRPAGDTSGDAIVRRPIFVILGGYRTGDMAATLIPDTHGSIIVALAYPYEGDLRVKGLNVLPQVPNVRRAILDTPPAVMLALDYLLRRPDVDPTAVEMVGASFGSAFGCVVGALDNRITRVWSVYGAARPYDQIELNLRKSIPLGPARHVVAFAANLFAAGRHLDPERWAPRISPRQFIMINARADERMPTDAVHALFSAASEPKELIWLDGPHLHRSRPEVLAGLVNAVLERASR